MFKIQYAFLEKKIYKKRVSKTRFLVYNQYDMIYKPFYDPEKSYEENFEKGPFGVFADEDVYENKGEPKYSFFGFPVFSPFVTEVSINDSRGHAGVPKNVPQGPLTPTEIVQDLLRAG